jgi:hypothetical protein
MKYFRNLKKQVCRFTMESRSKSFIFPHVVEEEQRGVMAIWCTSGLRRDPSITRGDLDASQSMRLTINEESDCLLKKYWRRRHHPGFRIWGGGGIWGANSYFGRQHIIFKKVLLFAHAFVTGLSPSPPRRFAPLSKGGEYPRNIAPPLGYSSLIYAVWFIQIISWYFHLISALHVWEFKSAKLKLFVFLETYYWSIGKFYHSVIYKLILKLKL